jgi:hypothetical protein
MMFREHRAELFLQQIPGSAILSGIERVKMLDAKKGDVVARTINDSHPGSAAKRRLSVEQPCRDHGIAVS